MDRPLHTRQIANINISQKPVRSLSLILLVVLFSFVLSAGALFLSSLSAGVENLSNRLGADVMIVPSGYQADIENVLLKGSPSTFYLPKDVEANVEKLEGVQSVTPQLFVATLAASCCSYPVQIIGIDPKTDFLIQPWLSKRFDKPLKDNEAFVGANVRGEPGEKVHFFNKDLHIAGRLEPTGIGFDSTVFVNMHTAVELAKASERMGINKAKSGDYVSVLMIKLKPNVDPAKFAKYVSSQFSKDGIFPLFSKRFVNSVSANLQFLAHLIWIAIGVLWVLSIIILAITFSAMLNERKKEMGVLKILGATRKKLRNIVLIEAFKISMYGGLIGSTFGIVGGIIWAPLVSNSLNIPFQSLSILAYAFVFIIAFLCAIAIAPLSCLASLIKINKMESYITLREND